MSTQQTRQFEDAVATRKATNLLIGLVGPSGSGKTFSALRLASGIQRVSGGDVYVIDTESERSLHYADRFRFRHVAFAAPFGPLDYLAAFEHCARRGARVVVVDSMSHEHEGPGGVLEQHDAECTRLMDAWRTSRDKVQMTAWATPKASRRRMINSLLQLPIHVIFCFRAKEKLRIVPGKPPVPRGWMPLAGEELVYELALRMLFRPGADGTPSWESEIEDEREIFKRPAWCRDLLARPVQITEEHGVALAAWAIGTPPVDVDALVGKYERAATLDELAALEAERADVWSKVGRTAKERIKGAVDAAKARLAPVDEPATAGGAS